ncbi:MAG: SDR family NAD(P)-dependent oxidoreductase [Chitinophagaceae bacterium]|nr:SDR family NAD(P)-dependent oxidoreductase [Chitinophagaceae bacterium]MCZ2395554.1 SDR family NAD(P)-dependent oxidoreductase [Chitinophagales bacterium]
MNRIVFITGATSGIGKACAEAFASAGDHLIINGRREERLEAIKNELTGNHAIKVLTLPFDVSDKNTVFDAIYNLPDEWKNIDILVNNAGLALGKDLFNDAHLHDWETMIETNVTGLLYVSKAVIPVMIKNNRGHIINISSIAGDFVYQSGNIYCATKSAVNAISEGMRTDMLPHHIKVTNIKPGAVDTEFSLVRFKGDNDKAAQTYTGFTPLSGEDIAQAILYCTSLPEHVCINDLTITPTAQANGVYFFKK